MMTIRTWIMIGAVSLASVGCHRHGSSTASGAQGAEAAEVPALSVADVAARMARHEALGIFDANSREQYEDGHVPGAQWIAFNHVQATDLPGDHDTTLVFYCHNEH